MLGQPYDQSPHDPSGGETSGAAWWREVEVILLVAFVALAYGTRLSALPLRGEEPRWVQVAHEMQVRGDWIVPREQGDVFRSRPPLHSWLIAASCAAGGTRDPWVVRLPSVVAMLLTTLMIYGYSRTALSRLGALAAALAFASFGELFHTGRLAETEPVFIYLLSASLLTWHWGMTRDWPALATWTASYALMALAVLTKGPQPPVYFIGSITLYLIWTGDVRRLFTASHLVGILTAGAIVTLWAIPCLLAVGWENLIAIVFNDATSRFDDWQFDDFLMHAISFPFEVIGCTLPWSILLVAYARPEFRLALARQLRHVQFAAAAFGLAFVSCWLPPGGQSRYITPLYPCLAVLLGVIVQRVSEADGSSYLAVDWRHYVTLLAGTLLIAALIVAVSPVVAERIRLRGWAAPGGRVTVYVAALAVFAIAIARAGRRADGPSMRRCLCGIALSGAVVAAGILTDVRQRRMADLAGPMADLQSKLDPQDRLYSFEHVDALFAYHLGRPIDSLDWPETDYDVPNDMEYFCFRCLGGDRPELPFDWEEIAAVPMDRVIRNPPEKIVVVGRRLNVLAAAEGPPPK
jgi:4-amino-4-deoxy-L-arabinose transferase-like glycosyltransferase